MNTGVAEAVVARSTPGWVGRRFAGIAVGLARLLRHVFFRQVDVAGLERIPHGVPLVFVANHNNSVVDSILLLGLPGVRPRMLAKSTLFRHPVMGPLLTLAGALPVYRRQDAGETPSRNFETFARCREVLAAGGQIALFPEGTSHNEQRRLPLKSGAARIVLEAEELLGPLGVQIVPVGLSYEAKDRFRSKVQLRVGQPIDPAPEIVQYKEEARVAVRTLTERIAVALEGVVSPEDPRGTDQDLTDAAPPGRPGNGYRVVTLPVYLLGCVLNWIPYRVSGRLSDALSKTLDEPATYKLLTGLLVFPLTWAIEMALMARLAGPVWGLAMGLLAPASGYAALRLRETRPHIPGGRL